VSFGASQNGTGLLAVGVSWLVKCPEALTALAGRHLAVTVPNLSTVLDPRETPVVLGGSRLGLPPVPVWCVDGVSSSLPWGCGRARALCEPFCSFAMYKADQHISTNDAIRCRCPLEHLRMVLASSKLVFHGLSSVPRPKQLSQVATSP
jgi:hypothetical protein